jgi:GNAT superfamily N-acetyltransferase
VTSEPRQVVATAGPKPGSATHRELARDLASPLSTQAAEIAWTADLITNTGYHLHVRPARPDDETAVAAFFRRLTPDDLRHRFLSALREVGYARLKEMVRNDDPHSINFLAFERFTGQLVATAMLVADGDYDTAEFALATRSDRKAHGISWSLLEHLTRYAKEIGIRRIQSVETSDDDKALRLERELGFTVRTCPDDATLMIAEKILR